MSHEKQLVYFALFGAHLLHVFTCTNHLCFHVEHLFICILAYVIKYYNHTYTRSQRSYMHKFKQSLTSVHVSSHAWNFTPLLFTVFSVFCCCLFVFLYLFLSAFYCSYFFSVIHQLSTDTFPLYFLCSIYLRHYLTKHLTFSHMTHIQDKYTS